jgi:hypothetical protein
VGSVVDLSVDERNPRSARFQLTKLATTSGCARCRTDRRMAEVEGLLRDCRADSDSDQGELFGSGTSGSNHC